MPHQHLGISVYDMVADLAKLKTALIRQFMDNKYLANNARVAVNYNTVNLEDLTVSRPGGVVRVDGDPGAAVAPMLTPDTGASALQGLEYLDNVREQRTGYSRNAQGMDSEALSKVTATASSQALGQAQLRLEMMARTIAETGMRDMFRIIHAMTLKHATRDEKIRLRNKWVLVNPREWVRRTDLCIAVGLGVGSGGQQMAKLQVLAPVMMQAGQIGLAGPQEAYAFALEMFKAAGYRSPEKFLHPPKTDPQTGEPMMPPPPPNPLVQVEQIKQQGRAQEVQFQAKVDAQREQMKAQLQAQIELAQGEKQRGIESAQMQADLAVQQFKMQTEVEIERMKAEYQAQMDALRTDNEQTTKIRIAEIQSATAMEVARINHGNDDGLAAAQQALNSAYGNAAAILEQTSQMANNVAGGLGQLLPQIQDSLQAVAQHAAMASMPKRIVRDASGRAMGVETVRTVQ
jgi:hypothetical protein